MAEGKVVQVKGMTADVEFPPDALPNLFNAVEIYFDNGCKVVGEVQERLDDTRVRLSILESTEGIQSGQRAVDTGTSSVPSASY